MFQLSHKLRFFWQHNTALTCIQALIIHYLLQVKSSQSGSLLASAFYWIGRITNRRKYLYINNITECTFMYGKTKLKFSAHVVWQFMTLNYRPIVFCLRASDWPNSTLGLHTPVLSEMKLSCRSANPGHTNWTWCANLIDFFVKRTRPFILIYSCKIFVELVRNLLS